MLYRLLRVTGLLVVVMLLSAPRRHRNNAARDRIRRRQFWRTASTLNELPDVAAMIYVNNCSVGDLDGFGRASQKSVARTPVRAAQSLPAGQGGGQPVACG